MGLSDIFKRKRPNRPLTFGDIADNAQSASGNPFGALMFGGGGSGYTSEKAMMLSAVYCAVNLISDGIAQLPIQTYKVDSNGNKRLYTSHPVYKVLHEPSSRMTRFTFIKMLVSSMLLRGNGYAYIQRDASGKVEQLVYIPPEFVTIIPPTYLNQPPTYNIAGVEGIVEAKDIIHILNFSYDGLQGISTLKHAAMSLGLAADAENHARGFFSGGCAIGGTLTVNTSLSKEQKQKLKESWQSAFSPETGRPNSVCILEGNMTYNPIGVDPTDSQLLETRQFSVIEIARWFNISPVKLFDLTKSSYSTVEATNISFLTDTLQPILQKFETEFERKLFTPDEKAMIDVKFDESQLLRADKQSQANYFNTLFNIGAMSINEIRQKLDLMPIVDGDTNFVQANLMSVSAVAHNIPTNSAITNTAETETDK